MKNQASQILIVDDVNVNLKLLAEILANDGYLVRPATTGQLALKSVAFEPPDLILLDISMPDMDGYEVCRRLKADAVTREIPVIFISALDAVEDKLKGFQSGGVDYITKPFQEAEVLARVATHLTLSKLQKQLTLQNHQLEQEIAERRSVEDALNASEERYRTVFENTGSATVIIEEDSTISLANAEFSKISGFPRHELEGLHRLEDFVSDADRARLMAYHDLRRLNPGAAPREYECRFTDRFGNIKDLLLTVAMIPGTKKSVTSMIDITGRKQIEEQLKYLSLHDPLTNLYNRTYFEQEMFRLGSRRLAPLGIIICDVDALKLVNDTLGHEAGDTLLVAAAGVIRGAFRHGDMAARIGGDEFAIVLSNSDISTTNEACQRIRSAIAAYNSSGASLPLSLSVGCATDSNTCLTTAELFEEADADMYRDKIHNRQPARKTLVNAFIKMMETRDFVSQNHILNLKTLSAKMASALYLPAAQTQALELLAKVHDLGKVGVPENILFKPGPLVAEEVAKMRQHCEIGYRIAMYVPDLVGIADLILKHHEWWNGKGYPLGIKEEEIPLACRIISIADAYDAMTNSRPYRNPIDCEAAIEEIRSCAGTQFDPALVEVFIRIIKTY